MSIEQVDMSIRTSRASLVWPCQHSGNVVYIEVLAACDRFCVKVTVQARAGLQAVIVVELTGYVELAEGNLKGPHTHP